MIKFIPRGRRNWSRHTVVEPLESRNLLATVSIVATQDNSLFEDDTKSNGAGEFLFTGRTHQPEGRSLRRALVAFDLENQIPTGATITGVSLGMRVSQTISEDVPISAHRVLQGWGEGTSDAVQEEGRGADATPGDATWLNAEFPTTPWTTPGGQFVETASATTAVGVIGDDPVWSSPEMIADVEAWLANPGENFGWILIGGEETNGTAKRFNSRENAENQPTLTVEFEEAATQTPTASVENGTATEGSDDRVTVEVTLSESPAEDVTVDFATIDGTATAGEDYVADEGSLTFTPNGPLTQSIIVQIINDDVTEADEAFGLTLTSEDAELVSSEATATILNDDEPPSISIADASIAEGDDQDPSAQLTVTLSNPSAFEISANFDTSASTAGEEDFVASSGTITFAPGETSKDIQIGVLADSAEETDEVFLVELTSAANATLANAVATVTILDDDSSSSPWQNADSVFDIDDDGAIVPRDVLLIFGYINENGAGPLPEPGADGPPPYYDVTGDNNVTARDGLLVINFINSQNAGQGEPNTSEGQLPARRTARLA